MQKRNLCKQIMHWMHAPFAAKANFNHFIQHWTHDFKKCAHKQTLFNQILEIALNLLHNFWMLDHFIFHLQKEKAWSHCYRSMGIKWNTKEITKWIALPKWKQQNHYVINWTHMHIIHEVNKYFTGTQNKLIVTSWASKQGERLTRLFHFSISLANQCNTIAL